MCVEVAREPLEHRGRPSWGCRRRLLVDSPSSLLQQNFEDNCLIMWASILKLFHLCCDLMFVSDTIGSSSYIFSHFSPSSHLVNPFIVCSYSSLSRSDPVNNPVQQCCSYFNLIISDQATSRLQMQLMLYDFLFQTNWSPHCSRPTCAQSWAAGTRSAIPGTETSLPTCDSRGLCFRIIHSVISYQACAMEGQASSPRCNKH